MASKTGTIFNLTITRPTRTDASLIASPFFHLHLLSKAAQEPAMSSILGRFSYIRRALYRDSGPVQYMGVNHRGGDIGMSQQFLDCPDVIVRFKQMRGKGMPEGMATDPFAYLGPHIRLRARPVSFPESSFFLDLGRLFVLAHKLPLISRGQQETAPP